METLEILEREHAWIGWLVSSLEEILRTTRATDRLPDEADELLALFESFADGRHQEKEERCLFPELLALADEAQRATLEELLRDHETERAHLQAMRLQLPGAQSAEPLCVRSFVLRASAYLALQRAHMRREQELLFPLAARLLTPQADARAAEGCARIEGGVGDPNGVREVVLALRERVRARSPAA